MELAKDLFTGEVIGVVIAGRLVEGNLQFAQPLHLDVGPVLPLPAQLGEVGGVAGDRVAGEGDELGPGAQPGDDGIHRCERRLESAPFHSRAAVAVEHEPPAGLIARSESGDRLGQ